MNLHLHVVLFIFYFALSSCQNSFNSDSSSSTSPTTPEQGLCTVTYTGDGYTVSGSAKYYYRTRVVSNGSSYLSNPATTPNPIRLAEIHIYNSAGTLINCSQTDTSGNFSLKIPATSGDYNIKVLSRTKQSLYAVSVKEDISTNTLYALNKTVTVNSASVSGVEIFAYARESDSTKIEGGAFNILDQIVEASEMIVGNSALNDSDKSCLNTKLDVYWKKGFNPYTYFGFEIPVSFYIPGDHELYILGGVNGDISSSDTDHFDDSVIIHEYGHFLEDVCARSDSPGGAHNGNFIIDPRLAWSEGWANYFQTMVSKDSYTNYYIDTIGFADSQEGGTPLEGITINLSDNARTSAKDKVSSDGEGTFREVSISRSLYKMTQAATSSSDNVPFAYVWKSFRDLSSSSESFRNVGLFNYRLSSYVSGLSSGVRTHFDAVMACGASPANNAGECQPIDNSYYASRTAISGSSCNQIIDPVVDASISSNKSISNQFRSNHFYQFDHDGSATSLSLFFTADTATNYTDLDLIVYKEAYSYMEDTVTTQATLDENIILQSRTVSSSAGQEEETISLASAPAGRYLINVKARTQNKSTLQIGSGATYFLRLGGQNLCPNPTW
jgi:hypothetical protein